MFKVHVVWFFFYKFGLNILVGEISPGLFNDFDCYQTGTLFCLPSQILLLRYSPRVRNRGNRQKGRFLLPGIEIERYKNSSAVDPYHFDLDPDLGTADPDPTLDPAPT